MNSDLVRRFFQDHRQCVSKSARVFFAGILIFLVISHFQLRSDLNSRTERLEFLYRMNDSTLDSIGDSVEKLRTDLDDATSIWGLDRSTIDNLIVRLRQAEDNIRSLDRVLVDLIDVISG
jgi:hypothetical protein